MSFAPYHNGNRNTRPALIGSFLNAETDNLFEFCNRSEAEMNLFAADFPHSVFVGNGETRAARILKTVAYIVTDENADGSSVVEKWQIKAKRDYVG